MASAPGAAAHGVVEDVNLLHLPPRNTYRQRTHPITGSRGSSSSRDWCQQQQQQQFYEEGQPEEEQQLRVYTREDEAREQQQELDDALVTQENDGSFSTQLSVDPQLLPFIIGRGGNTKKQLEQETGTTLLIPRGGPRKEHAPRQQQQPQVLGSSQSEVLTIKGSSKQAVSSARVRLQLLVDSVLGSRMLDFNYFVSVPLALASQHKAAAAKLQEFQQKVLSQPDAAQQGLDPSIFTDPQQLHLTLLMLKLFSDESRHKAAQALQGLQPKVSQLLGGQPLQLSLQGLDYMSDDPTDMHVLYLKVAEPGGGQQKLSALCELVIKAFDEAGLLLAGQSKQQVKLHATVINTRHRRPNKQQPPQQPSQQHQHQQQQQRQGFNGQQLLQDWRDLDLGLFEVPALHISQRGVFDTSTGYYGCFAALPLL